MTTHTLTIGDVVVCPHEAHYTCFGLGSCIGLFVQDRITGISGGAHILLPESEEGPIAFAKFYNVTNAVQEICNQFKHYGSDLTALRAKITGGANVINVNSRTGIRNAQSIERKLTEQKIYIAASDVGGIYFRTARFESKTGILTVRMPQLNQSKTF